MTIFVTGASGFIGSAVVKELIDAGHRVLGLARSEASAQKLLAMGAEIHRGDLTDLESIKAGALAADGVIHLGFIHDFTRFAEVCAIDKAVVETIGEALVGTDKPFIVTSGTALAPTKELLAEHQRFQSSANPRIATEIAVDHLAAKGVKVAVVRLPPSVHGHGDAHGFIPILINIAKEKNAVTMINDGSNVWPAVHRLDAAKLFRLAVEKAAPGGTRYHAVDDQGVAIKDIAAIISQKLNLPLTSVNTEDAAAYFTWFTHFALLNNPASGEATKAALGWQITHTSLLDDLNGDVYFPLT